MNDKTSRPFNVFHIENLPMVHVLWSVFPAAITLTAKLNQTDLKIFPITFFRVNKFVRAPNEDINTMKGFLGCKAPGNYRIYAAVNSHFVKGHTSH